MRRTALVLTLAAAIVAGCGGDDGDAATPPNVRLSFTVTEPGEATKRATLSCTSDSRRATGYLRGRSTRALCTHARRLRVFLDTPPDRNRPCTQIYGGPEKARVTGRIGARTIDRRFDRSDGCQIADWDRMGSLLTR